MREMEKCISTTFAFLLLHSRKDEEQGGRADQEADSRAHRDEGAGSQRVGAAGGHPLSKLIGGSYSRKRRQTMRTRPKQSWRVVGRKA